VIDFRTGDVRAEMGKLAAGSASLVASSPPFSGLRDYLPPDHPQKHLEMGSERRRPSSWTPC